jgi:hypothetical protein
MPGLKPIYQPIFTDAQVKEAERITKKHTASYNQVIRAKLVLLLYEQPDIENPTAAHLLGHHENWVRLCRKRWCNGDFLLKDKHRSGRKSVFSPKRPCISQSNRVRISNCP